MPKLPRDKPTIWTKIKAWRAGHEFGYHFIFAVIIIIVHQLLLSFAP